MAALEEVMTVEDDDGVVLVVLGVIVLYTCFELVEVIEVEVGVLLVVG